MNHLLTPPPAEAVEPVSPPSPEPLSADEFAELIFILDELRTRHCATPSWEFAEGFMAALVCCRRRIAADDYLPVLLPTASAPDHLLPGAGGFADAAQQQRFMALWQRRWNAVTMALDTKVTTLDDPQAYQPEVTDAGATHAALPEAERDAHNGARLPSFGQVWAQGFMAAVDAWPQEWAGPRNKAAATWRHAALEVVQRLTDDDMEPPTLSAFDDDDGPPSVSLMRMNAFADAIWAVYNMREMWRRLGPRIETIRTAAVPGRNDLCTCGSGKKYKKCCGG